MTKSLRACLAAVVLAASMACSESSTAPSKVASDSSTQASFAVSARPSPITATRCNPQCTDETGTKSYSFSATMTIDVQASGSVGGSVNSITLNATAGTTAFASLVISSDEIRQQNGTNHVDARAMLSTPLTVLYNTPANTANLDITISAQITDDRSNQVAPTGQVSVR